MAAPSGSAFSPIDVTRMSHPSADDQIRAQRFSERNESTRRGVMQGSRQIAMAVVGLFAAAVSAGAFTERGSGSGVASSSVRLLVQLNGPPPAQQHGGLTGSPGGPSAPGGPAGPAPAPALRGTFVLTGAVRDRGRAVLRLPTLGSGSLESTLLLRGARGALRVGMSGGGGATSGQGNGRWRVVGGSGAYAGTSGGGSVTQTPERAVLVGRLTLRAR
jgi:hypothetical protein